MRSALLPLPSVTPGTDSMPRSWFRVAAFRVSVAAALSNVDPVVAGADREALFEQAVGGGQLHEQPIRPGVNDHVASHDCAQRGFALSWEGREDDSCLRHV